MLLERLSSTISQYTNNGLRIYFPQNNSAIYEFKELEELTKKFCEEFRKCDKQQHHKFVGIALSFDIESLVILIGLEVCTTLP